MRKELGKRIRHLREQQGISQATFASMISMDRGYFGRVENGTCNPTLDKLENIADGLGVSLSFLMSGIGETPGPRAPRSSREYYYKG